MSNSAQQIVNRQDEILQAMGQIRLMQRGTISKQTYPQRAKRRDGKGAVGPYYLWQGTVRGKRFGKRVSADEARRVQEEIAQRQAFNALCEEYVDLSCQRAVLEREATAWEGAVKKGLKSRSNKAAK